MDEKLELVREWLTKAMLDLKAARTISENVPQYLDGAAFHCQQAVEKAIKALLTLHDQRFGKTHDLELLAFALSRPCPTLSFGRASMGARLDTCERLPP
jgi:HEPN domain-containing protein